MENKIDECELCVQTITNPVCVDCYLKHARYWLKDFSLDRPQMNKAIKKIKKKLPRETLNAHTCVICNRERVSVCMYCAFLGSSSIFLKLNAPQKMINTFLESSNFGIEESPIIIPAR